MVFELDTGGNRKPWEEIKSRDGFRGRGADVGDDRVREQRAGRGCMGLTRRIKPYPGCKRILPSQLLWLSEGPGCKERTGKGARMVGPMAERGASLVAQLVKNPSAMQETPVQFLGHRDPLEKG